MSLLNPIKEYLGDGVYIEFHTNHLRLYTSNGIEETNEIFMDTNVLYAFNEFLKRVRIYQNENTN